MQQLRQHHTDAEIEQRMDLLLFQIELAAAKYVHEQKQQILLNRVYEQALAQVK